MTNFSPESMPEFSDNSPIDVARLNSIIRNLNSLTRYVNAIASRIPQAPPLLDDPTLNPNPGVPPSGPNDPNPNDPTPENPNDLQSTSFPYKVNASWDDKGKARIVYPLSNVPNLVSASVSVTSVQFRPDGAAVGKKRDMLSSGAISFTILEADINNGSITYKFQGNNLNTSNKYVAGVDYPRSYKNITINFNIEYTYRGQYYPPTLTPSSGSGGGNGNAYL
jgi:hypothetical protein